MDEALCVLLGIVCVGFESLQHSRVKIEALDLASLERKKVEDKDDRHPLAYDAMERFETTTKTSVGS